MIKLSPAFTGILKVCHSATNAKKSKMKKREDEKVDKQKRFPTILLSVNIMICTPMQLTIFLNSYIAEFSHEIMFILVYLIRPIYPFFV